MLMVVKATEVFIGDLSVSPAEDYSQLRLNYQTTYQQCCMEQITIYNLEVFILTKSMYSISLVSLSTNEGQLGQIKAINVPE